MINRIKKIIDIEGMNPSLFADHIGISRSSMNHILNGRNNPSLDVVTKILSKFENISSEWLLSGKPPIHKNEKNSVAQQPSLFNEVLIEEDVQPIKPEYHKEKEITEEKKMPESLLTTERLVYKERSSKTITKIMVFYSDSTFESLTPDKNI